MKTIKKSSGGTAETLTLKEPLKITTLEVEVSSFVAMPVIFRNLLYDFVVGTMIVIFFMLAAFWGLN